MNWSTVKEDDITDAVKDVLIKILMFNVSPIKPEVLEFTKLITKSWNAFKVVFEELSNYKKSSTLIEKIIEVNDLEETGDRLYMLPGIKNDLMYLLNVLESIGKIFT